MCSWKRPLTEAFFLGCHLEPGGGFTHYRQQAAYHVEAWLQAIVNRIEIDDTTIRISGDKSNLERVVRTGAASAQAGVRSSIRNGTPKGRVGI